MKRSGRYIKYGLMAISSLVLLTVLLAAGVLWYLQTPAGLAFAQERINRQIPGRVEIDAWHWGLWRGTVDLHKVRLLDPEGQLAAGFERLEVTLKWRTLWQRVLTIEQLELTEPLLALIQEPDGRLSLMRVFSDQVPQPRPEKPAREPAGDPLDALPVDVHLHALRIVGGQVHYQAPDVDVAVEGIDLQAGLELLARQARAELRVARGRVQLPDLDLPFQDIDVQADWLQASLEHVSIGVTTPFASFRLEGAITDLLDQPLMDLQAVLNANLNAAGPHLPTDLPPLGGQLTLNVNLQESLNDPQIRILLTHEGQLLPDLPLNGLEMVLEAASRQVDLVSLKALVPEGWATLTAQADLQAVFPQGLLTFQAPDWSTLTYRAALHTELANLTAWTLPLPLPLQGAVSGKVQLKGRGIDPHTATGQVDLNLTARQFTAHEAVTPLDLDLALNALAAPDRLSVSQLALQTRGLVLEAAGDVDRQGTYLDGYLKLVADDLYNSLAPLAITQARGAVNLQTRVQGTLQQPAVELNLTGQQLSWDMLRIGDVALKTRLDAEGIVHVQELALTNQNSRLNGQGRLQLLYGEDWQLHPDLPLTFDLTLHQVDLADFMAPDMASGYLMGHLAGHLNVQQTGGRLTAGTQLQATGLKAGPQAVGDVRLEAFLAEGVITIPTLTLQQGTSSIEGQGAITLLKADQPVVLEKPQITFHLHTANARIEDFYPDILGRVGLTAAVEGLLTAPTAHLQLDVHDLAYHPIQDQESDQGPSLQVLPHLHLTAGFQDDTVTLETLAIHLAADEVITGRGWYALDQRFAVNLETAGLELSSIEAIAAQENITGRLQFQVSGQGRVSDPQVEARLEISHLAVNQEPLDDLVFDLRLADFMLHLQSATPWDLQARYHLQQQDLEARLVFDNWDLAPLFDLVQQPDLRGTLNGRVSAQGNLADWEALTAELDVSYLELGYQDRELLKSEGLQARMHNRQITIAPSIITVLTQGHLDLGGHLDLAGPLAFALDADIPLAVAEGLSTDIMDLQGNLLIEAHLEGSLPTPMIRVQVALQDAGMLVAATGQRVQQVQVQIDVTPDALTISRAEGQLDDGRFALQGAVALTDLEPSSIDLRLTTTALPVTVPQTLDLRLNTDLTLQGTPDDSRLSGDVIIMEGRYYQPVNLYPIGELFSPQREVKPAPREMPPIPFLHNLALDVDIRRRNPFWVDNNLARLDINPDLNLGGRLSQPVISGRAEVVSGSVVFQKRTFHVSRGVVDFVDPYRIDPEVDIHSQMRIRHYDIDLILSGPVSHLNFELNSTPREEDGDIISLLLFGKTTRELISGEGGSTASAGMMLAELVLDTFGDDLKNATGLDILTVEMGNHNGGADTGDRVQVTMGKELSRRMTVKYAVAAEKEGTVQRVITEYRFFENILLSGFQDSKGAFGGELQFRMEFR